ncbi:MAG: hypothetical protein P0Y64_02080 [Candidatus Sphingomonas colombiensis]|nr:hypothetical protein [Sphingomonas sp.]WEK43644.1 MAG: hypothetical protein P0Y64_02080 [Sphingomonas sp.]
MADFVTIANLAASSLGEDDQLRSPDDDTHLSRSVKAVWDVERQAAIRDHSWNFAIRRAALARVADQDATPYAAAYRMPATSLRLIEVLGYERGQYQLEGPFILSSAAAPLRIRYLIDVPEPAEWDALFAKVFAMRVAWQIADRITGDTNRVQLAERKYRAALSEAKRVDARENPQVPFEPGAWELSRGGAPARVDSNGYIWP